MKDYRITLLGAKKPGSYLLSPRRRSAPLTENKQTFILNHRQKYHYSETLIIAHPPLPVIQYNAPTHTDIEEA